MTSLAQVTTQPPRPNSQQAQQQNIATGLAIALVTMIVLAIIFQKKRRGGRRRGGIRLREIARGPVNNRIRRQLENKVGAGTAARLVDYERSRVPGKSENWYWEAALERLARDHGRR